MEARGIDLEILSVNQYRWYPATPADPEKFIRYQDEGLRDICARWPTAVATSPPTWDEPTSPASSAPPRSARTSAGRRSISATSCPSTRWPDIIAGAIDLSEQQRMAILGGNLTTMLRLPPALSA